MVINSEQYFINRVPVVQKALKFLRLPLLSDRMVNRTMKRRISNRKVSQDTVKMLPPTAQLLMEFARPWNEKLVQYLNDDIFRW